MEVTPTTNVITRKLGQISKEVRKYQRIIAGQANLAHTGVLVKLDRHLELH